MKITAQTRKTPQALLTKEPVGWWWGGEGTAEVPEAINHAVIVADVIASHSQPIQNTSALEMYHFAFFVHFST